VRVLAIDPALRNTGFAVIEQALVPAGKPKHRALAYGVIRNHRNLRQSSCLVAIREQIVEIIRAQGATPAGVLIALDREECGLGERSAVQEVQETLGLPVVSVLRLRDLLAHLETAGETAAFEAVRAYRDRYGV
jgi:hypothetical protein